ncbi:hypothetical protein F3157_03955 [Virgibacillus dakarensis]|uniref:Uncharacterized protein n=1 Tax=Lentibacillus populi TaxID=1827502 RepID=A0A9W5X465_9BACI|nr:MULTISPECIES: hypothetical protein [Bacillaceae]MBT2214937.1 hypothetical protein [Virgibacillus dakarensis]MTW84812.1 hypothetical protein [Virgibacillus dakarensis]GGB31664.1 hypothetical protein GCM10011409_06290 [Lentibacillus populi]
MSNQVSVFIMDVSNSSEEHIGNEVSEYLAQLKNSMTKWTQNRVATRISHRAGDELVVVCKGYATAYVLAFYISRIWKFTDHLPYFGLSFGDIQADVNTLNLETWIHPLMKQARQANDYLKNQSNRSLFRFALPRSQREQGYTAYSEQFEALINTDLTLKQEHMNEQTDIQSLVCSLYLILGQQNKVSQYLGRTTATISHHIKQGKTQVILQAFDDMVKVLGSLGAPDEAFLADKLQSNIRRHINHHLGDYFPVERSSS